MKVSTSYNRTSSSPLMAAAVCLTTMLLLTKLNLTTGHYVDCNGCDPYNRKYERVYPAWSCKIDDNLVNTPVEGYGYTTPGGSNDCECHYADLENDITIGPNNDIIIPNGDSGIISNDILQRYPYVCVLVEQDSYSNHWVAGVEVSGPAVDSCGCMILNDDFQNGDLCPPNKCDYSYTCGDTQYVCWDMMSPDDLLLNDNFNIGVTNIVYCGNDLQDNPFNLINTNPEDCANICDLDLSEENGQALLDDGSYICPNGQTLTRFSKFCSPDSPSVTVAPDSNCETCDLPFCDYGTDAIWGVTHFVPTVVEGTSTVVLAQTRSVGGEEESGGSDGLVVLLGMVAGVFLVCKAGSYKTKYDAKKARSIGEEEQIDFYEADKENVVADDLGGDVEVFAYPKKLNGGVVAEGLGGNVEVFAYPKELNDGETASKVTFNLNQNQEESSVPTHRTSKGDTLTSVSSLTASHEQRDTDETSSDGSGSGSDYGFLRSSSYGSETVSMNHLINPKELKLSHNEQDRREYSTITLVSAQNERANQRQTNSGFEVQGLF